MKLTLQELQLLLKTVKGYHEFDSNVLLWNDARRECYRILTREIELKSIDPRKKDNE